MNKNTNLTDKQHDVLKFIYQSIRNENCPPTIREIADHLKLSVGTIQDHLKALVKKGVISISKNTSRGISLVRENLFKVPVMGKVRAGMPIYAVEDLIGYLNLDEMIFPEEDVFALKVKGDSMSGGGILPDDFILVKKQEFASLGDIVVALVEDSVTVKRLNKKGNDYFLQPENEKYDNIPFDENVSIVGKVVKVIRNYS
ncbi:MAG: transcriptional repressor LexA [Candidatus Omnitrophica bacterium]|nr:transcriptional repressor LexA [Candidatus Omnitrophota bacterium]